MKTRKHRVAVYKELNVCPKCQEPFRVSKALCELRSKHNLCKVCYTNIKPVYDRALKKDSTIDIDSFFQKHIELGKITPKEKKAKKSKSYYRWKRFCAMALAMPKWVNISAICEIYDNCPKEHHVDHIIPIRGKNLCGLHVPCNLQYLPADENLKKRNN